MLDEKREQDYQRQLELSRMPSVYKDRGAAMVQKMREEQFKTDQQLNVQAKKSKLSGTPQLPHAAQIMSKDGKPLVKAGELIRMTPTQKEILMGKIKAHQKKKEEERNHDKEAILKLAQSGKIHFCDAFVKIKASLD